MPSLLQILGVSLLGEIQRPRWPCWRELAPGKQSGWLEQGEGELLPLNHAETLRATSFARWSMHFSWRASSSGGNSALPCHATWKWQYKEIFEIRHARIAAWHTYHISKGALILLFLWQQDSPCQWATLLFKTKASLESSLWSILWGNPMKREQKKNPTVSSRVSSPTLKRLLDIPTSALQQILHARKNNKVLFITDQHHGELQCGWRGRMRVPFPFPEKKLCNITFVWRP